MKQWFTSCTGGKMVTCISLVKPLFYLNRKTHMTHTGPLRIPVLQLIGLPWLNKVVLSCLVLSWQAIRVVIQLVNWIHNNYIPNMLRTMYVPHSKMWMCQEYSLFSNSLREPSSTTCTGVYTDCILTWMKMLEAVQPHIQYNKSMYKM